MLVLLIGDLHVPTRAPEIPAKVSPFLRHDGRAVRIHIAVIRS